MLLNQNEIVPPVVGFANPDPPVPIANLEDVPLPVNPLNILPAAP